MEAETKFDFVGPMRRSCQGKTVLVVDHDLLWQLRFCDYFLVLDGGKIVEQGQGRDLLRQPGVFRKLFDEQTASLVKLLRTLQELDPPSARRGTVHPRGLIFRRNAQDMYGESGHGRRSCPGAG